MSRQTHTHLDQLDKLTKTELINSLKYMYDELADRDEKIIGYRAKLETHDRYCALAEKYLATK